MKRQEELHAHGEGTSCSGEDIPTLVESQTGASRTFPKIIAKGKRQRMEALRRKQDDVVYDLELGATDGTQGDGQDREDTDTTLTRRKTGKDW